MKKVELTTRERRQEVGCVLTKDTSNAMEYRRRKQERGDSNSDGYRYIDVAGRKSKEGQLYTILLWMRKRGSCRSCQTSAQEVSAFKASNNKHVPRYKLVHEGYKDEYVTTDYTFYYPKPEHLKTCNKRWPSLQKLKRKGTERRHREYDKRCGGNKDKKHDLKDKLIRTVDGDHKCVYCEKTRPYPSSKAEIERRSNERPCEKLKQEHHDDR